jgi:hypothetical protein
MIHPAIGQEQITFYSQTNTIVKKNQEFIRKQAGSFRKILFLNGEYEVLEAKNKNYVGKVSFPSVFHHKKSFIFRKIFPKQNDTTAQYFLHFERITGKITVYLNDQLIFASKYNFLPYKIPLKSQLLTKNENNLVIHLDAWDRFKDKGPAWFPINLPRIYNGSSGSIYLEKRDRVIISDVTIDRDSASARKTIQGEVVIVSDTSLSETYELVIHYNDFFGSRQSSTLTVKPDSLHNIVKIPFTINPDSNIYWSPESPRIPSMLFSLRRNEKIIDEYLFNIGLRNIYFKENKLHLNDKPIHLRGVNYVYQDPNGIDLFDPELVLRDLLNIKSRGFNSVRVGFFPQVSRFYQLTDSLGILCLQDLSLPILTPRVLNDSTQFSEIISKIHTFQQLAEQHPSVVGIGLNHFYFDEAILKESNFLILNNIVEGDNQWFSYYTRFDHQFSDSDFGEIILLEMLDRLPADQLNFFRGREYLDFQIILSGLAMPLRYQSDSMLFSTDLGALVRLRNLLDEQKANTTYAGEFFYTYQDYYFETPSLQVSRKKDENFVLNSRGLFKINRNIKPETDQILKNKWSMDQENKSAPTRDLQTYLFLIVGIINFFVFLFIYRSYVDFRKNVTRSIRRPHGFYVELLERRLISQEQSLYMMIVISFNAAVMLGGIIYFFKTHLLFDYIISILVPFPELKYYVATIIWQPYLLILSLAVLIMIALYLFSIPVQIIVLFSGSRIRCCLYPLDYFFIIC